MSGLIRPKVNVSDKRAEIENEIEQIYAEFADEEQQNADEQPVFSRNILFVGLSMSGKTTLRRVLLNPRIKAEESALRAESHTEVIYEQDVRLPSPNLVLNMVELPSGMMNRELDLTDIRDECARRNIHGFHLICFCVSFAAGIDSTAIQLFELLIKHLGPDRVKPNLCLIITRCESKNDDQREKLRNEFVSDVGSQFITRHLGRGVHFSGALNNDDWHRANESLVDQFETIYHYRKIILQLIQADIEPFHLPARPPGTSPSTPIDRQTRNNPVQPPNISTVQRPRLVQPQRTTTTPSQLNPSSQDWLILPRPHPNDEYMPIVSKRNPRNFLRWLCPFGRHKQ